MTPNEDLSMIFGRVDTVVVIMFTLLLPLYLQIEFVNGDVFPDTIISSGGIKSELTGCHKKKGPNGLLQEYCYIRNEQYPEVAKYFETEQEKTGKSCMKFKLSDFNKNSPSIMYGEAQGRMGNQLLGYAMMLQLGYVSFKSFKQYLNWFL